MNIDDPLQYTLIQTMPIKILNPAVCDIEASGVQSVRV